ncbi:MAG: rhodanese-like domain-containing protein [Propionibacteriales bacterium]|nr:rhodanese-like domain-containing protein [Propionibacteriales bacterium]
MSETPTPEIDIEELAASRESGVLVDVREPDEYIAGHLPGAVLIPMGQLANRMRELDNTSPVFVICASGNRSSAMTDLLRSAGFDAVSVAGGTGAWTSSGRLLEGGLA